MLKCHGQTFEPDTQLEAAKPNLKPSMASKIDTMLYMFILYNQTNLYKLALCKEMHFAYPTREAH